jgi:hypothetical protein
VQALLAWRCVRHGTRSLVLASAAVSVVVAGVWAVSRTVGVPFGPGAGTAEAIGLSDVVATVYEIGAVAVAALLWPGMSASPRRARLSPRTSTIGTVFLWVTLGAIYVAH